MIVVNGTIEATPETIEAMRDAVATMEAASRAEPGCQDYTFSVELSNPSMLRITEKWDDMDALAAHFAMPHMAEFRAAMAAHPPISTNVSFYEATDVAPPGM